jgi:hypothetical protein
VTRGLGATGFVDVSVRLCEVTRKQLRAWCLSLWGPPPRQCSTTTGKRQPDYWRRQIEYGLARKGAVGG